MELLVFWFLMALVTAIIAGARGRNPIGWFLIGALISIFGLILVIVLPSLKADKPTSNEAQEQALRRPCPECAELIMRDAKRCRFCGAEVEPISDGPSVAGRAPCPHCGHAARIDATHCAGCKRRIRPMAEAAAAGEMLAKARRDGILVDG